MRARRTVVPCARASEPWILAATILGSSMVFIDGTVVNVALPALQKNLNATVLDAQWVVESYALFLAALLLAGGAMGDRFGRRRIFCSGVALFALASIGCGLAESVSQLIVARAIQGVAGALLVPGSLAIISASFDEARRGQAIGTWSGFTAITAGIGPVLGGWLIEHVSWRAVFFINVPLALIVLLISSLHVPESRDDDANTNLDWPGTALATLGLGGVVYGLIESSSLGFGHLLVLATLIGGALSLAAFFFLEARSAHPMLPLTLFRSRNFSGANLLTFFLYTALGGGMFFLPLNLIQVQEYSATAAGAAWLPFIVTLFIALALVWGLGEKVRRQGAAGRRSRHCRSSVWPVHDSSGGRQLLDNVFPRHGSTWIRNGSQRRAAHHGSDERRTGKARRRSLRSQQCGISHRGTSGNRGFRYRDGPLI